MLDMTSQIPRTCPGISNDINQRFNIYKRPLVTGLQRTLKRHHGNLRNKIKKPSKCVVCLEKASGMYFGAMVCLPCKSFFIRCTKDGKPQLTCLGDKNCSIDRTNRMRCQYCRYQKCLAAGMMRREKPECVEPAEGQELCRVCSDIANGIHFGVMTCEGCKKFFRRALKEADTYECKLQKICTLNPRNRNACRFCRYQKCLDVGMSRQAIRMGRPKKIKTEATGGYNEFCSYDTGNLNNYFCSKLGMNPTMGTEFKIEPPAVGYGSCAATYQTTTLPSSPSSFESHKYNNRPPVSPSDDSGIESDCGSPVHVSTPPINPFSNMPTIKTEPVDMYENLPQGLNTNGSSCQFNQNSHIIENLENGKNASYLQPPTCDFKMETSELDSLVPTLATELDIEDMNDILAALGQHMGNLGQDSNNNKNVSMAQQQVCSSNDSNIWCPTNQANTTTLQKSFVNSSAVSNEFSKDRNAVSQIPNFTYPQCPFPTNNYCQSFMPVWPSHSASQVASHQVNYNNSGYLNCTRQSVFPMFVS